MGSFKLKLVAYFSLIALLPFAAAFSGLEAVTDRNATRRADGGLETGVRAAQAAFVDEVAQAERDATLLARDPAFQRALAMGNRAKLTRLASRFSVRIEPRAARPIGSVRRPAVVRSIAVVGRRGRLGRVVAAVPIDRRLASKLKQRAGLATGGEIAFVEDGRVIAASARSLSGTIRVPAEPAEIEVSGHRFRALGSNSLTQPRRTAVVVMAPQARIDESIGWVRSRLFLAMLAALVLIAAVAYIQGRSIVATLGRLADAARGIARGRLGDRVHVRGRDEFASLATTFNQMADQLQARMRELEDERRRLRETTLRFGEALAATHDIDQLLRVIVETAVQATGATRGELTDAGVVLIAHGEERGPAVLDFPLSAGRESFGTLVLYAEEFTSDQRESAGWLVGHAVIALSNARQHRTVEQQALVDSLTGLANRRLCTAALEKELARAERFDEPLAFVLADIDDFKTINDRWGHPTGDEVLKAFAQHLRASVREIDLAGRWGGEEFALLLPGTDLEGGKQLAERIRELLAAERLVSPDGEKVAVTASFGVACFPQVVGQSSLVAAADAALYEAKGAGKDCVVGFEPSAVPAAP